MSFTNCINRINNTKVDDGHVIDVVVPIFFNKKLMIIQKHLEFYENIAEMNRV